MHAIYRCSFWAPTCTKKQSKLSRELQSLHNSIVNGTQAASLSRQGALYSRCHPSTIAQEMLFGIFTQHSVYDGRQRDYIASPFADVIHSVLTCTDRAEVCPVGPLQEAWRALVQSAPDGALLAAMSPDLLGSWLRLASTPAGQPLDAALLLATPQPCSIQVVALIAPVQMPCRGIIKNAHTTLRMSTERPLYPVLERAGELYIIKSEFQFGVLYLALPSAGPFVQLSARILGAEACNSCVIP